MRWRSTVEQLYEYDRPPSSPSAIDDEFAGASLDSKWSWLNQGSTTAEVAGDRLRMRLNGTAAQLRCLYQTAPSGSWEIAAKVYTPNTDTANHSFSSIFAGQSITQELRSVGIWNTNTLRGIVSSTPTSAVSSWGGTTTSWRNWYYFRMTWDGTDLVAYHSSSGRNWTLVTSVTTGYTPAIVGVGIVNSRSQFVTHDFGWFRQIA